MPVRLTANLAPSLASSRLTSGYQLAAVHARALSSYRPHPNTACAKHIFLRWPTIDSYASKRLFHASTPSFASAKDPYQVLGVGKNASAAEIKKVYFSLARKYHPDTNPDKSAREKFQEIQEAYDILKDDKKRADYDKYGAASQQQGFDADAYERMRQNPFNGAGFGGFGGFGGMGGGGFAGAQGSDLFESLFGGFAGGSGARARSQRGENLETVIGLSFMDACKGTSRTVNTTPVVDCDTCSGTGLKSGAKRSTCSGCGGSGTRTFVVDGGFQMASTCGQCGGSGTTIPRGSSCGTCNGVGKTRTRKSVEVDIPAGVEDGMVIRVPGAGDAPMSGSGRPGDLLVRISVAPSKQFRRQGPNLYHEARIPMHTAVLGGRVRIPTLDGNVDVRVPGGTQQGEEMVLKGRGVASRLGGYVDQGDLFVSFIVQLPRSLTARQRELLEKYADDVEGRTPAAGTNSSTQSSSSGDPVQTPSSSKNSDERKNPKVDENDDRLGTRSEGDAEGDEETPEQARKASA